MKIEIEENSRGIITGMTGSGKTVFARQLLSSFPRLVIIDIKGTLDDWNTVKDTRENWRRFIRGYDIRLRVTSPLLKSAGYSDYFDHVFRRVLYGANCMLYIDEMYGVTQGSNYMSTYLTALYTRGREAGYSGRKKEHIISGNIGVFASAQRPVHIPKFALTESTYFIEFQLQNPDDRKTIAAFTHPQMEIPIPDDHGFYYYRKGMQKPIYEKKLKLKD